MIPTQDMVAAYLHRLRELARATNHIDRFYLFMTDDRLADMEEVLADSNEANSFYAALICQYRDWSREMGKDKWQEVLAHNDALNGANRNALLDEIEQ